MWSEGKVDKEKWTVKTIIYGYDESYGCGEQELSMTGMTLNELISELNEYAVKGYGDEIVFDNFLYSEPITEVSMRYNGELEKEVVTIA